MNLEFRSNAIFKRKDKAEETAFPEEVRTFEERIKSSEAKINTIIESADMVAIARDIMVNHLEIDIFEPNEERLAELCDSYDPAVIVGICRKIGKNFRKAH